MKKQWMWASRQKIYSKCSFQTAAWNIQRQAGYLLRVSWGTIPYQIPSKQQDMEREREKWLGDNIHTIDTYS
jgi:hypothetical protein